MKYVSDLTGEVYDSEEACIKADKDYEEAARVKKEKEEALTKERKSRATEIEELIKKRKDLDKVINEKVNDFIKDYGSFHYTYRDKNYSPLLSFWDWLF